MDPDTKSSLAQGWRWLSIGLIYPITIAAGLNAVVRICSGFCVTLDAWSFDGALGNFSLGFPALAGLSSLWVSTLQPASLIARDRVRFLLVTTGLMTGLLMECQFLRVGLAHGSPRFWSPSAFELWSLAGPLLVGCVNLTIVIHARERVFDELESHRKSGDETSVPSPHCRINRVDPPVRPSPFRPTGSYPR